MALPLVAAYLAIVVMFCLVFQRLRRSTLRLFERQKYTLLVRLVGNLWGAIAKMLGQVKKRMDGIIIYLADQKLDLMSLQLCIPFEWFELVPESFDHEMRFEIDRLVSTFCTTYINHWHEKITIDHLYYKADFRNNLRRGLEKSISALYEFALEQTRDPELFLKFGEHLEHCLRQHRERDPEDAMGMTPSHEERFFANLLDIVFERVLPREVIDGLLECTYVEEEEDEEAQEQEGKEEDKEEEDDDNDDEEDEEDEEDEDEDEEDEEEEEEGEQPAEDPLCLETSVNPFRLFIYNIIIYTFLIPTVNKISKPLYLLYRLLQLLAPLSKVSFFDLISDFDETYFAIDDDGTSDGDAAVLCKSHY